MSMPRHTAFAILDTDLDAATRAKIKSGIKGLGHSTPDSWGVEPFEGVRDVYRVANPAQTGKLLVFWTHLLLGYWVGERAVRRSTLGQREAWWQAHKDECATKRQELIDAVNKPSFRIVTGDTVQEILDTLGVAFSENEEVVP